MSLSRSDLQKKYAELAQKRNHPKRRAIAETINDLIEPNRLTLDTVRLFMKFENINPGDNIRRQVRKGKYITRPFVPGMDLLTEKMPNPQERYLFMDGWIYAGANADQWAIDSGDVSSVEQMRNDLAADIIEAHAYRAFNLLLSVWNAADTPDNYLDVSATAITASALDTMIETVIDQVGNVATIVGTRKALLPVYKFAGFREVTHTVGTASTPIPTDAFQEYENTLRVNSYHGITLVELPNTRRMRLPTLDEKIVPTNTVLVLGDFPGTFYQIGDVDYYDNTDTSRIPPEYNIFALNRYSVLIDSAESIGVIKTASG